MNKTEKILILRREGSLGDSILTRDYYKSIKQHHAATQVDVFCLYTALPFLKTLKDIDNIYSIKVHKLRPHRCWLSFLFYGLFFRFKRYSYVIDDNPYEGKNWAFLLWLIGKNKVLHTGKLFPSPKERVAYFLNKIGIKLVDSTLEINNKSADKLNAFLEKNNVRKYIVLNCFGSIKERSFSPQTFNVLIKKLRETNILCPVIFPYQPFQKELLSAYKNVNNVFYFETSNPGDLFALIAHPNNALTITPDTSVIHITAVFHKKTVIFYQNIYGLASHNALATTVMSTGNDVNIFDMNCFTESLKKAEVYND